MTTMPFETLTIPTYGEGVVYYIPVGTLADIYYEDTFGHGEPGWVESKPTERPVGYTDRDLHERQDGYYVFRIPTNASLIKLIRVSEADVKKYQMTAETHEFKIPLLPDGITSAWTPESI